jgi:hypothetical protein
LHRIQNGWLSEPILYLYATLHSYQVLMFFPPLTYPCITFLPHPKTKPMVWFGWQGKLILNVRFSSGEGGGPPDGPYLCILGSASAAACYSIDWIG